MNEKLSITRKIGNTLSTLLLGDTKEVIARIDQRVVGLESDVKEMKIDIKNLRTDFFNLKEKVIILDAKFVIFDNKFVTLDNKLGILWDSKFAPTNSPRKLNDKGREILVKTGIAEIVEEKLEFLKKRVREKNISNIYDADIAVKEVMNELPKYFPEVLEKIKPGAFDAGVDTSTVLFIGSVYLRDLIFPELGFEIK